MPALKAPAVAEVVKLAPRLKKKQVIVVNLPDAAQRRTAGG
jgi:hypothetical protein